MQQVGSAVGLVMCLCGLGLMMRFGFRLHSRVEFSATLGSAGVTDPGAIRQHDKDLKGRLGFVLVVLGIVLQAVSSYCVWTAG